MPPTWAPIRLRLVGVNLARSEATERSRAEGTAGSVHNLSDNTIRKSVFSIRKRLGDMH